MKSLFRIVGTCLLLLSMFFLVSCKKKPTLPYVNTSPASDITQTAAVSGGNVTGDGGLEVHTRGVCWNTSENPTTSNSVTSDGFGKGIFTSNLIDLIPGTLYYIRAFASNNDGTSYGNQISFTTLQIPSIVLNPGSTYGTLTDVDGNVYKTIQIGTQVWMAENLKTTKYNDGTSIPLVTKASVWGTLSASGYCFYNNNPEVYTYAYGSLYNWYVVNSGSKNVCPIGWHVPNDAEWTTLTNYLGGKSVAGGKLKETGTFHWKSPDSGASNESGFTAVPGGMRSPNGEFYSLGIITIWWSTSESDDHKASLAEYILNNGNNLVSDFYYKEHGLSVRCLKD